MPTRDDIAFHLLPYQSLARRWRTPGLLLIAAGAALYWTVPRVTPESVQIAPLAFSVSLLGLLVLLYTYTALAARARVTCEDDHLTIRTSTYPVAFSYRHIDLMHPLTNLCSDAIIKCTRSKPRADKIHCDNKTRRVIHRVIHRRNRTSCGGTD